MELREEYNKLKHDYYIVEKLYVEKSKRVAELEELLKKHNINPDYETDGILNVALSKHGFSTSLYSALTRAGFNNLNDVVNNTEKELLRLPGIGPTRMNELKVFLNENDLELRKPIKTLSQLT